jgi:hypothetical protein
MDKVNDICWCPQYKDSIFSCSNDGFIIEWSLIESKVKSKWKASKTPITSLAIDASSRYLICSSKIITVWDLETKTKVKTFTGHSNEIFKLLYLDLTSSNVNKKSNSYFISAASNDRILNAWNFDKNNTESGKSSNSAAALASFTLNDGPVFIDAVSVEDETEKSASSSPTTLICAVTGKGQLYIFKHQLLDDQLQQRSNEKKTIKKPIKSVNQVNFETFEGTSLQIYGAFLINANNERQVQSNLTDEPIDKHQVCVVYGSHLYPRIEKLSLTSFKETKTILKRDDPFKIQIDLQRQVIKVETPGIPNDVKILVPGHMAPDSNNNFITKSSKRKSTSAEQQQQLSLEDRLNKLDIDNGYLNSSNDLFIQKQTSSGGGQTIPKTDNLLVLLIQGLQSNDSKMLNHVLQHKNEKVVCKTVRLLPNNYIIILLKELSKRLQGHAQRCLSLI